MKPPGLELFHRKAARLLDGLAQLVVEQLIAVVCGNINSIKARVSLWQILNRDIAGQVDGEEPRRRRSSVALQRLEPLQRHPR